MLAIVVVALLSATRLASAVAPRLTLAMATASRGNKSPLVPNRPPPRGGAQGQSMPPADWEGAEATEYGESFETMAKARLAATAKSVGAAKVPAPTQKAVPTKAERKRQEANDLFALTLDGMSGDEQRHSAGDEFTESQNPSSRPKQQQEMMDIIRRNLLEVKAYMENNGLSASGQSDLRSLERDERNYLTEESMQGEDDTSETESIIAEVEQLSFEAGETGTTLDFGWDSSIASPSSIEESDTYQRLLRAIEAGPPALDGPVCPKCSSPASKEELEDYGGKCSLCRGDELIEPNVALPLRYKYMEYDKKLDYEKRRASGDEVSPPAPAPLAPLPLVRSGKTRVVEQVVESIEEDEYGHAEYAEEAATLRRTNKRANLEGDGYSKLKMELKAMTLEMEALRKRLDAVEAEGREGTQRMLDAEHRLETFTNALLKVCTISSHASICLLRY